MSKDPAVLWYTKDWLADTILLTFEEKGRYADALNIQHQNGHYEEHKLRNIIGDSPALWRKFIQDEQGLFYNLRMEKEILRRKSFAQSRKDNVNKRWANRGKQPANLPPPQPPKKQQNKHRIKSPSNSIVVGKGKLISFSYFQKLVNQCGDKEQAARVVYRSQFADDPISWIADGMKDANPYALKPHIDEDIDPRKVRDWIDTKIYRIHPQKMGDILEGIGH